MTKLVKIESVKKPEVVEETYVNPDYPDLIKELQEWIEIAGCSEIQIVVTSGCMSFSEVFDTQERTEAGLGALRRYESRYARELDAEYFGEDEE